MTVVARRIIKQIAYDKRSIGMIAAVPVFLLTLLYLLLGKSGYIPHVLVYGALPQVASALEESDTITAYVYPFMADAAIRYDALETGEADAIIEITAAGIRITLLEPDSVKVSAVTDVVGKAIARLNPLGQISVGFIHGEPDESLFDSLGYLLLGIMSFFLIFIFAGISFVRERTSDTVERLMLTPVKTVSVVGGYVLGFSVFAALQSALMILYAKLVLKIYFVGEWWLAMMVMLLIAVTAVVMGVLVSALAKNEFQVMQFIPVVIIPQMFFSGLIPVDTLPYNLNAVSKAMPLYYGSQALKGVLVYGHGFMDILPQILVLTGIIAVLFGLNILAVRKYRAV